MSRESVLITAVVDVYEHRDVAIVDIPGTYLSADMDEEVHLCLQGQIAEMMVRTAPEVYTKYVTLQNGKPILYVRLIKALCGCLSSALLFYNKLVVDIEAYGFTINPYDPCVTNKMVNEKQLDVTWHVDDLNISHVDSKVVTGLIEYLKSIYGKMHGSCEKKHTYLGMWLDYSKDREVNISTEQFLCDVIS